MKHMNTNDLPRRAASVVLSTPPAHRLARREDISVVSLWALLMVLAGMLCSTAPVSAAPMSAAQARLSVQHWLSIDPAPLREAMSHQLGAVTPYCGSGSTPLYYVVALRPTGYVIVSAEDRLEPIIAFVPRGVYAVSPQCTLSVMLDRDLPTRMAALRTLSPMATAASAAQRKWAALLNMSKMAPLTTGVSSVTDVRVSPLLSSAWSQQTAGDQGTEACYNYYTPQNAKAIIPGNINNYPSGCVATAMAQLMYYWQYPTAGVGTAAFLVTVDGKNFQMKLRGGDGAGGAYQWTNMSATTSHLTPAVQCAAIGALCADAGASINMQYTLDGSGAYSGSALTAFTSSFQYSNCRMVGSDYSNQTDLSAALPNIINPNFDAGLPVIFGISGTESGVSGIVGHEIVGDGYGYDGSTWYTHLNMGWSGIDTAWYNLPTINEPDQGVNFNLISACLYNIYKRGTGEVLSGRVLDTSGNPINGATVTAVHGATTVGTASTNAAGIYYFAGIPSASSYTLTGSKSGYASASITKATGTSVSTDEFNTGFVATSSGNVWGANITLASGAPPTATPTFSPPAGSYSSAQSVTIADSSPNATIYYTTNGTTPTIASTPYTGVITVSASETIEAMAIAPGYSASAVVSATYTITPPAATPTFSPPAATYISAQSVTITDTTTGATIYYTTNGTTPTIASTKYTGGLTVSANTTIKAIAIAPGYSTSVIASATYTITPPAATPTFSPVAGTYTSTQSVTIADTTTGATIYCTTNGMTPTNASTKFTGAITVSTSETIKAIAIAPGYSASAVASAMFTITPPAATPTFSLPAGTYLSARAVIIADTTIGATIYYTTNGTTPTTASTKYTGAITVSASATIKAIAIAPGYSASAVGTAAYTINPPLTAVTLTATPASPQTMNTPITLQAGATGGTIVEFSFMFYNETTGTWSTLQGYSTNEKYLWTPQTAGVYQLLVMGWDTVGNKAVAGNIVLYSVQLPK